MKTTVSDIRKYFKTQLDAENFTIDKTGTKTIELIGASFLADKPAICGIPNEAYIKKEILWYNSGSTNINDIYGDEREAPAAWKYAANKHGEINSNYGHLIFSEKYHSQFKNVVDELCLNPDGRRATMVYNRPSIWKEFNENGKSDFICTNAVTYYIRDNALHAVVQMRSNDIVFGYKNDYAWAKYVVKALCSALADAGGWQYVPGDIYWQCQNLHVFERHFELLEAYTD